MFRDLERQVTLMQIDQKWISHLQAIDYLREGINLRAYAQIDPLVAFKKEAYEYFQELQNNIQRDIVSWMFRLQIAPQPVQYAPVVEGDGSGDGYEEEDYDGNGYAQQPPRPTSVRNVLANRQGGRRATAVASGGPKVGRNDPCPCGSGKKYKRCCGA